MEEIGQVTKGGICWFEISFSRGRGGLEVAVKTVPQIEAFMKSLGEDHGPMTAYGKNWHSLNGKEIFIHGMTKVDFPSPNYAINRVAEPLESPKDGRINLSFLRMVGISEPQGVRFGVTGPFSKPYIRELSKKIAESTRALINDFIVPIHINLRLSSQEI